MRIVDNGTDDSDVYAEVRGAAGTTGKLILDNPGVDDFEPGHWNCFEFQPSNLNQAGNAIGDIGFHEGITIGFLSSREADDYCIDRLYSRRWENWNSATRNGDLLQTQQYLVPKADGTENKLCVGDDGTAKMSQVLPGKYKPKRIVAGTAQGRWIVGCSGGQNCKTTMTKSMSLGTVSEDSWSREVQNAVTVSIEAGVEFASASASTSVSTSYSDTRSTAGSIARSSSKSFEETCESNTDFTEFDVSVVYQWQVDVPVEDTMVTIKTCQLACRSSTGPEPRFGPLHPESLESCKIRKPSTTTQQGIIAIQSATYGGNCGAAAGNVSADIVYACDGKASCNYVVDFTRIGDPAPGCAKDYQVAYQCSDGQQRNGYAAPEAGFESVVSLACN